MQDIQDLLARAAALGEAMAKHPRVQNFTTARQGVKADSAAQKLLEEHQSQLLRLQQLENQHQPIEVADKQKLKDIEMRMAANDALKRLLRAQADYIDLMNRVNQAMEAPLADTLHPEAHA
jgi:cell fate (sporulation/competence/biofilm development) regulator YlbF (YheA/YmcA/DUF963 family)